MTTAREARAAPRYRADEVLSDHWQWRPEWTVERPCLLWYLTFENQPRLRRMVETLHARLAGVPEVDAVPAPWLHLTVEDVAFVDEIAPQQVHELVAAAASTIEGWRALPLFLGPVAPMGDALVLEARPEEHLRELRERLRACTSVALGPDRVRGPQDFRPHVSFGYVNAPCGLDQVLGPIADLVHDGVVVSVPTLTLAAVTRRNRHYQWIARASLDLQAAGPVADPVENCLG